VSAKNAAAHTAIIPAPDTHFATGNSMPLVILRPAVLSKPLYTIPSITVASVNRISRSTHPTLPHRSPITQTP
jgi:hypothetical protein